MVAWQAESKIWHSSLESASFQTGQQFSLEGTHLHSSVAETGVWRLKVAVSCVCKVCAITRKWDSRSTKCWDLLHEWAVFLLYRNKRWIYVSVPIFYMVQTQPIMGIPRSTTLQQLYSFVCELQSKCPWDRMSFLPSEWAGLSPLTQSDKLST